jgi:Na+-translocating ferredoxin:NAD+ oxidoreductase RnfC subunit
MERHLKATRFKELYLQQCLESGYCRISCSSRVLLCTSCCFHKAFWEVPNTYRRQNYSEPD